MVIYREKPCRSPVKRDILSLAILCTFTLSLEVVHKTAMVALYPCFVWRMLSPRYSAGSQFVWVDMQHTATTCSGEMIFYIAQTDSIKWSQFPSFFISGLCSVCQKTLQGCTQKFDWWIFRYCIQYFVCSDYFIGVFVSLLDILNCFPSDFLSAVWMRSCQECIFFLK